MTRDETNGCRNCAWCEFYVRFYGDDVCGVFCCYFFFAQYMCYDVHKVKLRNVQSRR